jgi:nucleotide-binding universal stress UspA family protein
MKAHCVVVGYDGSANARRAVEAAIDLVAADGTVHVVTAHEPSDPREATRATASLPAEFSGTIDALATPTTYLHDAERLLEESGVRHQSHLIEGDPAAAILDHAEAAGADLIVVGSRGIRHGARFLRGSVSTRIATHARPSFLVVHHDG